MGGMFYSLQEAIEKLSRTEQEIRELVRMGKLREFRDGQSLLFKIDEVESLLLDTTVMNALGPKESDTKGKKAEDDIAEILLMPDEEEEKAEESGGSTDADTVVAGEGINVLEETSGEYTFSEDTKSETKAISEEASLEAIEKDVNLDTFGSGSGLLDLSLQADDTSLGGILDEIYTPEGVSAGEKKGGGEDLLGVEEEAGASGSVTEAAMAEEAEQIMPEEQITPIMAGAIPSAAAVMSEYAEPVPDAANNLYGVMLLLVLVSVVYAIIMVMTGAKGAVPAVLGQLQGMIWYIMGGAAAAVALIFGMTFMVGGSGKPKVAKKIEEVKKEEKKEKKAKKEKKGKKGKEEPKVEEEAAPPSPEAEPEAEK